MPDDDRLGWAEVQVNHWSIIVAPAVRLEWPTNAVLQATVRTALSVVDGEDPDHNLILGWAFAYLAASMAVALIVFASTARREVK